MLFRSDLEKLEQYADMRRISIHVPHVGRDGVDVVGVPAFAVISIHVPHVGRDGYMLSLRNDVVKFQSTCPMWGATRA